MMMQVFSFINLISEYIVEIPMLQRDYAYGRLSEKEKRNNFLNSLKSYFEDNKQHELDFIYGSIEKRGNQSVLTLLDGQQRMTTLFLLHWYLAVISDNYAFFKTIMKKDNDEKSRFTYKTRFSSTDFCNFLVDNGEIFSEFLKHTKKKQGLKLSDQFKKEKWFLGHWLYDPTIDSMLNMLDDIVEIFDPAESQNFYDLLVNNKTIVFNFLDLENFSLTDELYIKMNSRGRALTRFENLKTKWLKLYDEFKNEPIYKEKAKSLNLKENQSIRDYVAQKIDGEWTDAFWYICKKDTFEGKTSIDDMMLNYIVVFAINDYFLSEMEKENKFSVRKRDHLTDEIDHLMSLKKQDDGNIIPYVELINLLKHNDGAFLFNIINYFNAICENNELKKFFDNTSDSSMSLYINETDLFEKVVNDHKYQRSYDEKFKFYLLIKYVSQFADYDNEKLKNWIKFVCKIGDNSYQISNSLIAYMSSLAAMMDIMSKGDDIEKSCHNINVSNYEYIDKNQLEEEILKIKISEISDWREVLEGAEKKYEYFNFRLRYPLIELCNIDEYNAKDDDKKAEFINYVEKIGSIFGKEGCQYENELMKAVLSKGNYLLNFSRNHSFLKNDARDNSWRRFLREKQECDGKDKRDFFRKVIDDECFDSKDVKNSLTKIYKNRPDTIESWRKCFIDCDKLILSNENTFTFGKDRCIRHRNNNSTEFQLSGDGEIDLISKIKITSKHAELYSLVEYYRLKNTFSNLEYKKTETENHQPYFYFNKDDTQYNVYYQGNERFFILDDLKEHKLDSAIEKDIPRDTLEMIISKYI